MDELVLRSLECVAYQGLSGCSLSVLWQSLHIQHDTELIAALWVHMRYRTDVFEYFTPKSPLHKLEMTDRGILEYDREPIDNPETLSLERAYQLDCRVVAAFGVRLSILGLNDPDIALIPLQYCILEALGKSGSQGLLQSELATLLNVDQRSLFHHIKKLKLCNLLTAQPVLLRAGGPRGVPKKTNVCHLWKFCHTPPLDENKPWNEYPVIYLNQIIQLACSYLQQAKDHIMVESDLKHMLRASKSGGIRWRPLVNKMIKLGIVEHFTTLVDQHPTPCLKLLRLPGNNIQALKKTVKDKQVKKKPVRLDLPPLYQVYKLIEASGSKGITQMELFKQLDTGNKTMTRICSTLVKEKGILSRFENRGRQMTYRLFHPNYFSVANGDEQATIAEGNEGEKEKEKEKELEESDSASRKRKRGQPASSPAKPAKRTKAATPKKGTQKESQPSAQESPTSGLTSPRKKKIPVTLEFTRRKQTLSNFIHRDKAIPIYSLIRMIRETETDRDWKMDKKSLNRIISTLEAEGVVKTIHVSIPTMSGAEKRYDILVEASLDASDSAVISLTQQLRENELNIRPQATPKKELELKEVDVDIHRIFPNRTPARPGMNFVQIAAHYGYIRSKMIRVKWLHQFLWNHVYGAQLIQQEPVAHAQLSQTLLSGKFKLSEALLKMPIRLYLQVFAQTSLIDGLDEAREQNLLIEELPAPIKDALFYRRLYMRHVYTVLNVLQDMHLVRTIGDTVSLERLWLSREACILDTTQKTTETPGLVRHYRFDSLAEVMRYWTDLEYLSQYTTTEDINRTEEEQDAEDWARNEDDLKEAATAPTDELLHTTRTGDDRLAEMGGTSGGEINDEGEPPPVVLDPSSVPSLGYKQNWTNVVVLSKQERDTLQQYMEQLGEVPTKDQVKQLSLETGVPMQGALSFYNEVKRKKKLELLGGPGARRKRSKVPQRTRRRKPKPLPEVNQALTPLQRRKGHWLSSEARHNVEGNEVGTDEHTEQSADTALTRRRLQMKDPSHVRAFKAQRSTEEEPLPEEEATLDIDSEEEMPPEEEESQRKAFSLQPQRVTWNMQHHLDLIRSYLQFSKAIGPLEAATLARSPSIPWDAIAKQVGRSPTLCKHRIFSMSRSKRWGPIVELVLRQEGMKPALSASTQHTDDSMELVPSSATTVAAAIPLSSEDKLPPAITPIELPDSMAEFHAKYTILGRDNELKRSSSVLHQSTQPPITHAVLDLYKMILLNCERGIPHTTYQLFADFSERELESALFHLRMTGCVVRNKGEGLRFRLSSKFNDEWKSSFMDQLCVSARSSQEQEKLSSLLRGDLPSVSLSTAPEGGDMACVLSLMADEQITVAPISPRQKTPHEFSKEQEEDEEEEEEEEEEDFEEEQQRSAKGKRRIHGGVLKHLLRIGAIQVDAGNPNITNLSSERVILPPCNVRVTPTHIPLSAAISQPAEACREEKGKDKEPTYAQPSSSVERINVETVEDEQEASLQPQAALYLRSIKEEGHLSFLCALYSHISSAGENGMTMADLLLWQKEADEQGEKGSATIAVEDTQQGEEEEQERESQVEEALQQLLNFEDVCRVGNSTEQERYVSRQFLDRWCFKPLTDPLNVLFYTRQQQASYSSAQEEQQTATEGEKEVVKMWKTLDGNIRTEFIQSLRRKLFGIIMAKPGIYESSLLEMLPRLGRAAVMEVLQTLLLDGAVEKRCTTFVKPSLFSPPSDAQQVFCYYPTTTGLLCLATASSSSSSSSSSSTPPPSASSSAL